MNQMQRLGLAPMSLDERLVWARQLLETAKCAYQRDGKFSQKLAMFSMQQHVEELEAKVTARDAEAVVPEG
jgi:hypothetical protein